METQDQDTKQESNTTSEQESSSIPTRRPYTRRSQTLFKRWRKPVNVKDFASQINHVATMILNNEIDMDVANSYCRLTRSFAQLMTTQTVKARFLKTQPDLDLQDNAFED